MPQHDNQLGSKKDPGQWVHIDDFSPGCFAPSNVSTADPITGQTEGAADFTATFACSVIKGGSLGPLPALVSSVPYSTFGGLPGTATSSLLVGFSVTPNLLTQFFEVVAVFESDDGTDHYVKAYSYVPGAGTPLHAITGPTITSATTPGFFGAPYPAFTRLNADGSAGPPPPGPKLIFPTAVLTDPNASSGHLWVYPSVAAPTTFAADDLNTGPTSIVGQVITYGNRVICICGVDYDWPAGGGINTNENFNYTDPPESAEYGNQQTIMAVEAPWGYGAWGTQSVGELLLVKKVGGGVILNGDINVPTSIIRIPGIQSTGDLVGLGSATPIGFIYCSENQGAWLWNGGDVSQKMSQQLPDDFFNIEQNLLTNNYGFNVEHWHKWVMFSGNVWYDTDTNSWWNLYPKAGLTVGTLVGKTFWWYNLTNFGNQLLAAPLQLTSNNDSAYSEFDNTVGSSCYQWRSLPIHVAPNADRTLDIRQVIVRCSDPSNTGLATVTVSTPNGSYSEASVAADTPITNQPTMVRFNVGQGAQGLQDIVIQVLAENTSGNPAPIIESIDVEYKVRQAIAVAA